MSDQTYIPPLHCAEQFDLYADANKGRNEEREHGYRHCADFLREFCQPINSPERTAMLLMYRALKIMVASTEWSCMLTEEQDEILYAIKKFEEYNRDAPTDDGNETFA